MTENAIDMRQIRKFIILQTIAAVCLGAAAIMLFLKGHPTAATINGAFALFNVVLAIRGWNTAGEEQSSVRT